MASTSPRTTLRRLPASEPRLAELLATLTARLATTAAGHDADGASPARTSTCCTNTGRLPRWCRATTAAAGRGWRRRAGSSRPVAAGDQATALVLTMTYPSFIAARIDMRYSIITK